MRKAVVVVAVAVLLGVGLAPAQAAAKVIVTQEPYGSDPQQVVTVSRLASTSGKTVIFLHGGSWMSGDRGSLATEAAAWAKAGWVAINVNYRLGAVNGSGNDGKNTLADMLAVLTKYRAKSYVDAKKIVVYGESAGGHLATWLGAYKGDQIAATVAISPVSSIAGAILAGREAGAELRVQALGNVSQEYFGYSTGTTDAHRYLARSKNMFIAFSTDEWVAPNVHGRALCKSLGTKCRKAEYAGVLHAGALASAQPQLRVDARRWADAQLLPVHP